MNKNLLHFKGLYGDNHVPLLPDFIHHESLQIRSKMYDWEIREHLHTELYQMFIIQSGSGIMISQQKEIVLESPCIVTIPTNTLHGFYFQPDVCGDVITFSESYLENIFANSPQVLHVLNQFHYFSFDQNTSSFEQILHYENQIIKDLMEENPEKQLFVQSLFQLFFVSLYRFSLSQNNAFTQSDNRTLRYFRAFQKSIKESLQETKSINEYAKELNITAVHLNRICQTLVQKSALQIVQEYLINEAKTYLLNTTYSVSEVSYFLNFKDPAYFTRVFKKLTGFAPTEFRKK